MLSLSKLTNILTNIFIIIAFFMRNYLYDFIIYNMVTNRQRFLKLKIFHQVMPLYGDKKIADLL